MKDRTIFKRSDDSLPRGKLGFLRDAGTIAPSILRDASRRLAVCSLVMSGITIVVLLIFTVGPLLGGPQLGRPFGLFEPLSFATLILSLAVFSLARSRRLPPPQMLDVGLWYEIILAFIIGVTFKLFSPTIRVPELAVSEICILILIFPVIVPNTPRKTLLAAVVAASMDPLGILLAGALGKAVPSATLVFEGYLWNYVCAALTVIPAHILNRLGRQASQAREIGQYQMLELLGRGGMGEVWRARHRMLARPAAIKLIRPEILGAEEATRQALLRRFEREAQATAELRSKHTITIYDFGITEEGVFYYVMELLDGLDLHTLLERFGPVPPARAIFLLRQASHSLMDAHEHGMVHRDIKPANLYICRLGPDHDFVKVLDFGLVKSHSDVSREDTRLTQEGVTFGTPSYMPPEMATGAAEIDGRADLYALGCVGYWLLTGQLVFEGDTPLATVLHHVNTTPVPPSRRTELEIPSDLEEIILACLAKDPATRPQSARELDRRLASCKASAAWTPEQAEEWWTLHIPPVEASGLSRHPLMRMSAAKLRVGLPEDITGQHP